MCASGVRPGTSNLMQTTFTNNKKLIYFDYTVLTQSLPRFIAIKDRGVTLTGNLNVKYHISRNVSKAFNMCGFIKRVCTTFTDVHALRYLYKYVVGSRQLEYCSVIWNPWQRTSINKLERDQKRISNSRNNLRKYKVLNRCMTTFNTLYLTEPTCDIFMGASTYRYEI